MSTKLRVQVLQACDDYLSYKVVHPYGFCAWVAQRLQLDGLDSRVHDLVAKCRPEMAGLDPDARIPAYIGNATGRTPERIQFVQDLRDYLLLDI